MKNKLEYPLPNRQILVCKWFHAGDGEIIKDCEEINSNEYNAAYYNGGWEYVENKNGKIK